ncbi:PREDICTED: uncharacterized protein LOC108773538 [Cyphomyrmex costatus]|uniref:Myb/SANT-like DNA-binding domain-containing protein n=1 Tax=Cyphomyrmex costatus TaxID=456900 RepID=A0A151IJD5_9HYME|nr:PREDICTED: uncharacterized protein LOC108773538 [Cyphomyrmex costatus]KYN03297.1 hypothetical protein ALC62_05865 [Cyphomyrmex costatus]
MKETNNNYNLTGQQCSNKLSGLKRTYRSICDQNKRSGNCRSSWAFFSVMDSIFGNKACTKPLSEASSDGPTESTQSTTNAISPVSPSSSDVRQNPMKKRKVEVILENYMEEICQERESKKKERFEENLLHEQKREARYEKERLERAKMHEEKMEVDRALIDILQKFINK